MTETETETDYTSIFYKSSEPETTEAGINDIPKNESVKNESDDPTMDYSYDALDSYDTYRFITERRGTETLAEEELEDIRNSEYHGVIHQLLEDYQKLQKQNGKLIKQNKTLKHIVRKQEARIIKLERGPRKK